MGRHLRIAFLMPKTTERPIGGAKTVYQYADYLASRGHHIAIFHPKHSILDDHPPDTQEIGPAPFQDPHPWYRSSAGVQSTVIPDLSERWLKGAFDLIVINNQRAVDWVARYSQQAGQPVYFLQDYESYVVGSHAEVEKARRTLQIDWPIVCTSPVVQCMVESVGRTARLLHKAVDTEIFFPGIPIESPLRRSIGFPSRPEIAKRTADGIQALDIVRSRSPIAMEFWCFGYERWPSLPPWISQHVAPTGQRLAELYSSSSIFVVASEFEGYGLPGAEAMACGAALVSTRNGGVETYAADKYSALLCPVRDPEALAAAILRLITNDALRQHLARNGADALAQQTIPGCAAEFEQAIFDVAALP